MRVAALAGNVSDLGVSLVPSINWYLAKLVHNVFCQKASSPPPDILVSTLDSAERIELQNH